MEQDLFHLGDVMLSFDRIERNQLQRPAGWSPKWEPCVVCGRPLAPGADGEGSTRVLMDSDLNLLPAVAEVIPGEFESLPVGTSCVKKVPKAYRWEAPAHE
jgi:hypothetical protein